MRHCFWLIAVLLLLSTQPVYADGEIPLALSDDAVSTQPASNQQVDQTATPENGDDFFEDDDFSDDDFGDDGFDDASGAAQSDSLEGWNRFWFKVNDCIYMDIGKPAHAGYRKVVPSPVRTGISNLTTNWFRMPRRFVNALLQGKFNLAGIEFSRFFVNTTFGFAGLLDIAKNLKPVVPYTGEKEDFGQTLGYWGVPSGPYIVLPFFGPSTLRDTCGIAGDSLLPPTFDPLWVTYGVHFASEFNSMDTKIESYETITGAAIEPYSGVRDAYLQLREAQVAN